MRHRDLTLLKRIRRPVGYDRTTVGGIDESVPRDDSSPAVHEMAEGMILRRSSIITERPVYAVYAISSLDTEPSLKHRTQNMQLRRDATGSCRAHSPALHVGRRDRVASWSWSCASHPHAHLHAQVGLISASVASAVIWFMRCFAW